MIRQILLFAFVLLPMTSTFSQTQQPPLETGVSKTLAKWRAANYSDVRYKLNITLEKQAPLMKGEIEIRVNLTETGAKNDLILDWRTTQFQNDKDKPFAEVEKVNESIVKETVPNGVFDYQINKEHLVISKKYLKTGENTLLIKFASPIKTSGAAVTRYTDKTDDAEYVYFLSNNTNSAFPVFDQPDLKAILQFNVTAPSIWRIISNTASQLFFVSGSASAVLNDRLYHEFAETKPISTYVFAFAAGEFMEFEDMSRIPPVKTAPVGSTKIYEPYRNPNAPKIYVRKSQAEKFKRYAAEVFRDNQKNKSRGSKLDIILLPEFPFVQSDYEGLKFLSESSVFR